MTARQLCECRGRATRDLSTCYRRGYGRNKATHVGQCEALLCSTCAGGLMESRCCACGAPAAGHFRLLVADEVAS